MDWSLDNLSNYAYMKGIFHALTATSWGGREEDLHEGEVLLESVLPAVDSREDAQATP